MSPRTGKETKSNQTKQNKNKTTKIHRVTGVQLASLAEGVNDARSQVRNHGWETVICISEDPFTVSEHCLEGSSLLDSPGEVVNIRTHQIQQRRIVI